MKTHSCQSVRAESDMNWRSGRCTAKWHRQVEELTACFWCYSLSKCLFIYSRLHADVFVAVRHPQNCLMAFVRSHPPNTRTHRKIHTAWTIVHSTQTLLSHYSQHDREKHGTSSNQQESLWGKNNPPCVPAVHVESQQTCLFSFTSSGLMLQLWF